MQLRELLADADRQIEELSAQLDRVRDRTSPSEPVYTVSFSGTGGGTQEWGGPEHEDSGKASHAPPAEPAPSIAPSSRSASSPEARWNVLSPREQVHELHQQGVSSEMIATKTGMAIGEVELIISLGTRRGGG